MYIERSVRKKNKQKKEGLQQRRSLLRGKLAVWGLCKHQRWMSVYKLEYFQGREAGQGINSPRSGLRLAVTGVASE